jgi:predicted aspartyl protease
MITGMVTATPEVVITLPVFDSSGLDHLVDFALDTGYSGWLTLPPALIATLGLRWRMQGQVLLPNGTIERVENYDAVVEWDGSPRAVIVQAVDTQPLLGMKALLGHDLRVRVAPGGAAEIEAIP